jgi:CRP-like cAMP-binding protein
MEATAFIKFIHSLPGITEQETGIVTSSFRSRHLRPKEFLSMEGEICKDIGYVSKGCLSYYHLSESGKKSISHFAFEDWWAGDLESFLARTPAQGYWQALEACEIICISRNNFDVLMNTIPAFKDVFQLKTQTAYNKAVARGIKDKMESGEEKYLRMLKEYPQIIQRVPHYDVASYLGLSPETLSRIRHKLSTGR